jgi:type IV secretory pathway VirB4 component
MNKKFGRVLFMRDWGQALNDNTLTRLMELRTNMMLSLDIIPLSAEEQKSLLDDSEMNAEGNIDRWSQRPGAEKRPFARIPMRMKKDRQIVEIYNDDVTSRGQKIFLCNLTICLLADTMELLDEYTDSLIETGYECGCQLQVMGFQQLEGLQTVLPFGPRYIQNLRDVTTESAAILLPFNAVSMNHETGIPYGVHADTKQEMMIDRRLLPNGNEWVIGVSGSGKSMRVKITAIMEALITNGDIIFLDPHGEFVALTEALGGQVIRLGGTSTDRINALDMCHGYGEGNDTKKKSAFLISLFRSFLGSEFTKEMESILDRCCILAYKEYQMNGYIGAGPTLYDLFRILQQQEEDAAKKLTLLSEQYITGSFNYFSGYTNVDLFSRITCYDLSDMDENMWDAGMTVAMDSIWNRLILNKAANVPTFIKIDEVGRFLTNPYLTSSFESFYSEVRKYGGYITGIIQNVNKLTNSNAARNMLANSEIVVMLRQDTMDAAELKDIYDLSKIQVDMLREAENGCGIFKCGTSFISFDGTIEPGYIYDLANTKPRHEY